jgi:hypothetical protein
MTRRRVGSLVSIIFPIPTDINVPEMKTQILRRGEFSLSFGVICVPHEWFGDWIADNHLTFE